MCSDVHSTKASSIPTPTWKKNEKENAIRINTEIPTRKEIPTWKASFHGCVCGVGGVAVSSCFVAQKWRDYEFPNQVKEKKQKSQLARI